MDNAPARNIRGRVPGEHTVATKGGANLMLLRNRLILDSTFGTKSLEWKTGWFLGAGKMDPSMIISGKDPSVLFQGMRWRTRTCTGGTSRENAECCCSSDWNLPVFQLLKNESYFLISSSSANPVNEAPNSTKQPRFHSENSLSNYSQTSVSKWEIRKRKTGKIRDWIYDWNLPLRTSA